MTASNSIRCPRCGAPLTTFAKKFCEHCGAQVVVDIPPPVPGASPPPVPPTAPLADAPPPAPPPPPAAAPNPPPRVVHEPEVLPPPPRIDAPETGQFSDGPGAAMKAFLVSAGVLLIPCCGIGLLLLFALLFLSGARPPRP